MIDTPKFANIECVNGAGIEDGMPLALDFEFESKGNITFTYNEGKKDAFFIHLCSPFLFVIRELAKRTHFSVIPILVDSDVSLEIEGYDEKAEPQFASLYYNETDIYLSYVPITEMIGSFVEISSQVSVLPIMTILGGIYPSQESDSLISSIRIFDRYFWALLLLSIIITPIVLSIEVWEINKFTKFVDIYFQQFQFLFESTFLRFQSKNDRSELKKYLLIYGIYLLMGSVMLNAFSTSILSTTITSSNTVIDSLEDLVLRNDLIPLIHLYEVHISQIKRSGTSVEKIILEKALQNTDEGIVKSSVKMLEESDNIHEKVAYKRTHVFIASPGYVELIEGKRSPKNIKITHIANTKYFDHLIGAVYSRKLDKNVAQTYNQILYDIKETGLYRKWNIEVSKYATSFFEDKDRPLPKLENKLDNYVVKVNPALGPLFIGVFLSVNVFIYEICIIETILKLKQKSTRKIFTVRGKETKIRLNSRI